VTYQLTNLTVVTGASSGVGAEIARRLAARKARLLLSGRDAGRLRTVAGTLNPAAPAAELTAADLADPAGIDTLAAAIGGRPVDLLVNNAGVATYGAHADLDPRAEAGVIAVNCTALAALTRAVLPGMLERRRGFVLNIASTIAFQPAPGQATYGASKAFVLSYSEALAEELGGTGVRVAAICPGPMDTAFLGAMGRPEAATSAIYRRHGSAAHVADIAARMLDGRRVVKVAGLTNSVMAKASRLTPAGHAPPHRPPAAAPPGIDHRTKRDHRGRGRAGRLGLAGRRLAVAAVARRVPVGAQLGPRAATCRRHLRLEGSPGHPAQRGHRVRAQQGIPLHRGQRRPARRSHLHPHQHTARHPSAQQGNPGRATARRRTLLGPSLHRATQRWLKTSLRQRPPRSPARSRARTQDLTACLA